MKKVNEKNCLFFSFSAYTYMYNTITQVGIG